MIFAFYALLCALILPIAILLLASFKRRPHDEKRDLCPLTWDYVKAIEPQPPELGRLPILVIRMKDGRSFHVSFAEVRRWPTGESVSLDAEIELRDIYARWKWEDDQRRAADSTLRGL